MAFTNPTSEVQELVSVEVPRADRILSALGGLFWLVLGLIYALSLPVLGHVNHGTGDVYFGIVTMFLAAVILWQALARRRIIVSSQELRYETSVLGLSTTRRFALNEIKNLRVDQKRIFSYRPWIAIDCSGKRKFIGQQLPEIFPPKLLYPIYQRFPQLAPGK